MSSLELVFLEQLQNKNRKKKKLVATSAMCLIHLYCLYSIIYNISVRSYKAKALIKTGISSDAPDPFSLCFSFGYQFRVAVLGKLWLSWLLL